MEEPLQGDWWLSVREDLESLELNLSLHDIKSMSKDKFKNLVQKAIKAQAFSWLLWKKSKSEKVKSVPHGTSLEMQKYLAHPVLSISQTKFLFAARAKMLFVRSNYPHMYSDKICQLCMNNNNKQTDNQEHLLCCEKLNKNNTQIIQSEANYEDLFSYNLNKQATISLIIESRYKIRKSLIDDNS